MRLHPFYRGKVETTLKRGFQSFNDFANWCKPGVAAPCRAIQERPERGYDHTNQAYQ
jgi:malate dehydrogenase (oxaloacetate-decarboxylating)